MHRALALLVVLVSALVAAVSPAGNRLLVVLEQVADQDNYSQFLADLRGRGFDIAFETTKSESLQLFHLGERKYDHVLLLPVKAKGLGPSLTPSLLVQFVNERGNLLIAQSADISVPSTMVSLLAELDIASPPDRTGTVVDHFHYDAESASESHDVLLVPAPRPARPDVRAFFQPDHETEQEPALIAFPRAIGHMLGPGPLLAPIVTAPRTAYLYNSRDGGETIVDPVESFAAGSQMQLVSAVQAHNSGRVVLLGSAAALSDRWFDARVKPATGKGAAAAATRTWNREFARRLTGWAFHEIAVLRVNAVEHHLHGSDDDKPDGGNVSNPTIYCIKNEVTYSVSISEYAWDRWIPFEVPAGDVLQLEFSMLSPYQRLGLDRISASEDEATYGVTFQLPDQHGIFNFLLNYKRPFLSNVVEKRTVSVRHIAHDEWPRSFSIPAAWPWLAGICVTIGAWLLFCAMWMYGRWSVEGGQKKKTQ